MGRLKQRGVLVVLVLLAVVNLPFAHGAWVGRQIDRDGVEVTATVTQAQESGDGGLVEFVFDPDVDPDQTAWQAALDADAFEQAVQDETVEVRVVPGSPNRYEVAGEIGAGLLVVLTVFADVVLLIALVLMMRRRAGPMRLVALEDVARARHGGRLERLSPTTYLVVGEVSLVEADAVVLDTGAQSVWIDLSGFANPVGYEQPAQVRCRLPDSAT